MKLNLKKMKFKKIYFYDKKELTFKENKKLKNTFRALMFFSFLSLVLNVIVFVGGRENESDLLFSKNEIIHMPLSKESINPSQNKAYKDSVFTDYQKRAEVYLSRPEFTGTPLNAKLLTLCAKNTYDSTGVLVPVELALLQAQMESSMGRAGRSPKNNPFNLGESTKGTTMWFNSTFDGTQAYYYLMANNYLRCRTTEQLLMDFRNCRGRRYAEHPEYEIKMSSEFIRIKRWINNNI
jgi:hypothetical protein